MHRIIVDGEPYVDVSSLLYRNEKTMEENFSEGRRYIVLKLTEEQLQVADPSLIFSGDTKYLTKVDEAFKYGNELGTIFMDTRETTAHAVYLKNFRKYNPSFFTCEERVFYEALLVKYKAFKEEGGFTWSLNQTQKELGIKRTKRETIIKKFTNLGIIETESIPIPGEEVKEITRFKVNIHRVIELIPKIYDKELADLIGIEDNIRQTYL